MKTLNCPSLADKALTYCREAEPRKKNWLTPRPTAIRDHLSYRTSTVRYKGFYKGFAGSEYTPLYYSVAEIIEGVLVWSTAEKIRQYKAPRGYHWDFDENGVKLVKTASPKDDYHFDGDVLLLGVSYLRSEVLRLRKIRLQQNRNLAKKRKEQAEFFRWLPKLFVRLQDSQKAGNCIAGTLAYAERHGVSRHEAINDPTRYLPGAKIDQNDNRAVNAAKQAFYRETLVCI